MNALKTVADIMTRKVVAVSENDTLERLEESMRKFDFHHLPVVEGKKLIGLISHGDLLHASSSFLSDMAEERNKLINKVKVGTIMQRELITVGPEEPLQSAGTMMLEANVRCLPVVTDGDTLIGMVTGGDFIRLAIVLLDQRARGSTPPPPDQRAKGSTPPPPPATKTPPPLPRQKGTLPPPSRRVIALRDAATGRVADINAQDAAAARKAAEKARKEASAAQKEASAAKKAAAAAQKEVEAVKKEVEVAKKEAEAAKQEAEAARREAEAAEKEAVAVRKEAEATKKEAAAKE